jgi:hypothetical protein
MSRMWPHGLSWVVFVLQEFEKDGNADDSVRRQIALSRGELSPPDHDTSHVCLLKATGISVDGHERRTTPRPR